MRNIFLFSLVTIAIFTTGCSTKVPGPMIFSSENNTVVETVKIRGSYNWDNVTPVQNLAIAMKKAALHFKSQNIEYFTFDPYLQVPPMITNFKDLSNYCYPSNEHSSSLEDKCKISFARDTSFKNDIVVVVDSSKKSFAFGTWSVKQVLNDPLITKSIEEAKNSVKTDIYFSDRDPDDYNALSYLRGKEAKEVKANQYIQKF